MPSVGRIHSLQALPLFVEVPPLDIQPAGIDDKLSRHNGSFLGQWQVYNGLQPGQYIIIIQATLLPQIEQIHYYNNHLTRTMLYITELYQISTAC